MSDTQIYICALAMVLAALGMWLMLPRGNRPGRLLGAVCGVASLLLFGSLGAGMGSIARNAVFGSLAGVTLVAAAATVTFRSPVYCALWFALSLLGTAGLFLMQGAPFLGIATVVVYAGAILVTFLFVLMLAQPGGHAYYDRVSWEGMLAAAAGAVIVGFLTMTVVRVLNPYVDPDFLEALVSFKPEESGGLEAEHIRAARIIANDDRTWTMQIELTEDAPIVTANDQDRLKSHLLASLPAFRDRQVSAEDVDLVVVPNSSPLLPNQPDDWRAPGGVLDEEHVATLGAQLFSRHLIALEVAGTLLLVALVGAIAIVQQGSTTRPASDEAAGRPFRGVG